MGKWHVKIFSSIDAKISTDMDFSMGTRTSAGTSLHGIFALDF